MFFDMQIGWVLGDCSRTRGLLEDKAWRPLAVASKW